MQLTARLKEEKNMSREAKALKKENNELEKQLSKETEAIQTDIVVYIRSANISDIDQERVRRDITQMLIDGEARGESAADVIGGDYKAFCDEIIAEIPKLSRAKRVLVAIRDVLPALMVLFAIWAVFSVLTQVINGDVWYITPLSLSDIITGAALLIAASLIVVYITKNSFSSKPAPLICLVLLVIAIALCGALLLPDKAVFSPHIAADAVLLAVLYAAYKIIDSKL